MAIVTTQVKASQPKNKYINKNHAVKLILKLV